MTFFKEIPKVVHIVILGNHLKHAFNSLKVFIHKNEFNLKGSMRVDDRNDVETSMVSKNQMVYVARHVKNLRLLSIAQKLAKVGYPFVVLLIVKVVFFFINNDLKKAFFEYKLQNI